MSKKKAYVAQVTIDFEFLVGGDTKAEAEEYAFDNAIRLMNDWVPYPNLSVYLEDLTAQRAKHFDLEGMIIENTSLTSDEYLGAAAE